ncbi:MAG: hypothetical protein L0H94_12160 [Nitrospira sp.]|nr:hypothetical protein [Nitrospira sp.]
MILRYMSYIGIFVISACTLSAEGCAKPADYRAIPMDKDNQPSSTASQSGDLRVLAGAWEYIDGAAIRLALDEQGNSRYDWKDGRLETSSLTGHSWRGMWFQKENDRDGEFMVEFSPDFSEGEGRWWYSRIGTDHSPMQKGGTFHLRKKTTTTNKRETPPAP